MLNDVAVLDQLIHHFNQSTEKSPGVVIGTSGDPAIDPQIKKSTNVYFKVGSCEPVFVAYQVALQKSILQYIEQFKFSNWGGPWTIKEPVTIQSYEPGEGFFEWHSERLNASMPMTTRHLVFMTYLNDVREGGETEFFYQGIKVKPRKGRTLIWPADWTHTHRGIPSLSERKIIITGWLNYY